MEKVKDEVIRSIDCSIGCLSLEHDSVLKVRRRAEEERTTMDFYFEYGLLNYAEYQACIIYLKDVVFAALTREDEDKA